jgi:hypothetical protein
MQSIHATSSRPTEYGQLINQSPEYRSLKHFDPSAGSVSPRLRIIGVEAALALMLVTIWLLTHRYGGLTGDAKLYAVQALAKLHPALATDLYLQNNLQDRYTIFSSLYASLIGLFGLQRTALLLSVLLTIWFLAAAWRLADELSNRDTAWLALAILVITVGSYGAYDVFHFSENYLTARSFAEALVVTAFACHFKGMRWVGLSIAAGALLVHPLMALPGLLLLVCLWLPLRLGVLAATAGILAALGVALAAVHVPSIAGFITVIDTSWLEIVRQRSQFLFVQLWSFNDWERNARPFVSLALSAIAIQDERIQKLSAVAIIVGISGLAVAAIASMVGPVAVFLQGQAWRWVWITGFVSALLMVPTVFRVWKDEKCGALCAILIVAGWTFADVDSMICLSLALMLWLVRAHISDHSARYLRWAAVALGIVIAAWIVANSWTITSSPFHAGRESLLVQRVRSVAGLHIPVLVLFFVFWYWIRSGRSLAVMSVVCLGLLGTSLFIFPASFNQVGSIGATSEIDEFADWRRIIPLTSNVYVANGDDSSAFAWFTLGRPNYLSLDQSAGVVFSRTTAFEVERRSAFLLPLMDPDWKMLSRIRERARAKGKSRFTALRTLTGEGLIKICRDPSLGYLIAQGNVGFDPVRHNHPGLWNGWNLYDCGHVRDQARIG